MTIVELLQHVGLDDITVQSLRQNCTGAKLIKGDLTEVRFVTDQTSVAAVTGLTDQKKVGLVVWVPFDKLPESMKK